MGLDIHVMRPRRFFVRDFTLPIRQLLPDITIHEFGVSPMNPFDAETTERVLVKTVRLHQLEQESHRYVLPECDEVVFSERFSYVNFNLLREFAAHFDYPVKQYMLWGDRAFGDGYDVNAFPSVKSAWRTQRTAYPHLIFHEDTRGFYFPTTLRMPVLTDVGYLGSTTALRRELTALAAKAQNARRHRDTIEGAITLLLNAVDASERSKLPIVFDG